MATQKRRSESLVDDPGIWFGISIALLILTLLVAGLADLGPLATAVAVVGVGGLSAARLPGLVALVLGVVAWAFFTGFIENSFGQLTFTAGDLARLATFAALTAAIAHLIQSLSRTEASHG